MAGLSGPLLTDWPFDAPAAAERRERHAAWLRGGLVAALLFALPPSTGDGSRPDVARKPDPRPAGDVWREARAAVRQRFVLAAAVRDCRHTENLYGFNLLLAAAGPDERAALEAAARDAGRAAAPDGAKAANANDAAGATDEKTCLSALQDLDAADDGLVLLAERASRSGP